MGRLEGRVGVVTGAGQGIGRAIALGLAAEGASVVIADIRKKAALKVQEELERSGQRGIAIETDVCKEESVNDMAREAVEYFGKIDILVNNAGVYPVSALEDMREEEWDLVLGVNLSGVFLCSKAVVPKFLEQHWGRIINLASGRALQGAKNAAHYAASKAGIIGFTKSLALELASHGITVNALCPGVTDTAQPRNNMTEEELYAKGAKTPLGRIGQAEDLVGPATFFASEAAGFVTGQTVIVNGGAIMW